MILRQEKSAIYLESTDKNNEKSQDNRKVQRQEASKEAKNVSSSQQDCNDKPAPLDSVEGVSNILDNIPDSILNKKSAVKPDLAENQKESNFPANNLRESCHQISESQPD